MSILLEDARLSFPALFKKEAFDENTTPKFKGMFIIDKTSPQLAELKKAMKDCMVEKWGAEKANDKRFRATVKLGLHDGSDKENMDGFGETVVFLNASSAKRPSVFDADKSVLVEEDGRPYAGCYVNVRITPWAQDNKFGKRVNFELNGVQFSKDGESFGGGGAPASEDDFPDLEPGDGFEESADEGDYDPLA